MYDKKVFVIKLISLLFLFTIFLQLFMSGLIVHEQKKVCNNMGTELVIDQETGKKVCLNLINIPICNNGFGGVVKESDDNLNFSWTIN